MKTLVLENDPDVAQLIARKLQDQGIHADMYQNPDELIALLEREHYQVILLGDHLGGADGLELTSRIRSMKIHSHSPEVILMTNSPKISVFDCHQAGACHLLKKPLNLKSW